MLNTDTQYLHKKSGKPTKEDIEQAKQRRDYSFFKDIFESAPESTKAYVLRKIGRLPEDFRYEIFLDLLPTSNHNIKALTVKNLGKSKNPFFIKHLKEIAIKDGNANVRRECVSSIGRIGTNLAVPILLDFLNDRDARVVVQAIRGLLKFRECDEVKEAFMRMRSIENELISEAIEEALNENTNKSQSTSKHSDNRFVDYFENTLVCGDCIQVLKHVPDESIHLCFTSPPYYNAKDYSIFQSYNSYLDFLTDAFKEVHRVLKEGRVFVLNTSPVLIPRMSRKHQSKRYLIPFDIHPRLLEIGFDFIDDIIWVKPGPSAKNRNGGFFQQRKPLMYKANSICEYVIVYRKHTDRLIDWNLRQYPDDVVQKSKVTGEYEKTNVWNITPSSSKFHPAVFPKELASRVIQFYSFTGDCVLDPFSGFGTVGVSALELNRSFFLIEKEVGYCEKFLENGAETLFTTFLTYEQFIEKMQNFKGLSS